MIRKNWIYLLGAIICLAGMSACEETESIGANLRPDELSINTEYVNTFKLETRVLQLDSIPTLNLGRVLFGSYTHPFFGTSTATAFTQMLPPASDDDIVLVPTDISSTPVYDSVALGLNFNYFQGDESLPGDSRIMVYELDAGLDTTGGKSYYSFESLPYTDLLGDSLISFEENTSFVRLNLDDNFGRRLFDKVLAGTLNNRTAFAEELNGIAIKTDGASNAMFAVDPTTTSSSIRVFYHYMNGEDTVFSTLNLLMSVRFHNLETDRSGTPLEGLTTTNFISSEQLGNIGAVQAGTGVTSHIAFPYEVLNYGLADGRVVDRAELIMNPIRGSVDTKSPPPSEVYFTRTDESGRYASVDEDGNTEFAQDYFGQDLSLEYNSGGQSFNTLDITRYIELLANEEIPNTGLILSPRQQGSSTVNHFIFGDAYNADDYSLELRIFYTDFQ